MKKLLKLLGLAAAVVLVAGASFLALSPGLRSDPAVGLGPTTHEVAGVDVRTYTDATLRAEVKVYLPISVEQAMSIVADFSDYPSWVDPAPETVTVDNSATADGRFGAGSVVSYREGESDVIELHNPQLALIARPQLGLDDFADHRGVVFVTNTDGGSIMHMRRYFEPTSPMGWIMSKMMPRFMERSAENLAEIHGGMVL